MDTKLLIDAIVRQTTVLIAQLSTAAGIRAPLAHVADQVFVELAREIESQGVGRKVVADMFGLSLRSYQKKVRRLTQSQTVRDRSLWEAVIDFVRDEGSVSRLRVEERFRHDDPLVVGAVLNDLVSSGLLYATGRGDAALYGLTSESDKQSMVTQRGLETICSMVWMEAYLEPRSRDALAASLAFDDDALLQQAVDALLVDGRLELDPEGLLRTSRFVVPIGSAQGWEAAVFDHFRAMATAIATKVGGVRRSRLGDVVGGSTLSFDLHPDHPYKERVLALLSEVREQVLPLWEEVTEYNQSHAIPDELRTRSYFYFGQYVEDAGDALDAGASLVPPDDDDSA